MSKYFPHLILFALGWFTCATAMADAVDFARAGTLRRLPPIPPSDPLVAPVGALIVPVSLNQPFLDAEHHFTTNPPQSGEDTTWGLGEFRVRPYGVFWADMVYATQRTFPGAYSLFVYSADEHGENAFAIDARRTRFGLDVSGPAVAAMPGARSSGRVEIDFHGNFITENRASVLLRHAYWEVKDESMRLLVGQTWDVISPLTPGMLDFAAGFLGGNIGFRRTQFRAERYFDISDRLRATLEGSLNQDIVTDFPTDPGIQREASNWPVVQGRFALTFGPRSTAAAAGVVGISAHVGETGFDFLTVGPPPLNLPPADDARFLTWSFNVDLHLPITERLGVQGEFFTGANLSAYLGGVGTGVCPCLRIPIRSTGGWLEVWYDWTPDLHSHVGLGIDDPRDNDSQVGRIYNHFLFANLVVDLSDQLTTGLEVTSRKTLYHETRAGLIPPNLLGPAAPGQAVTIDWMVRYEF